MPVPSCKDEIYSSMIRSPIQKHSGAYRLSSTTNSTIQPIPRPTSKKRITDTSKQMWTTVTRWPTTLAKRVISRLSRHNAGSEFGM